MTSDDQQRAQMNEYASQEDDASAEGSAIREDGPAGGRRGTPFDPTPHIQQLRGRGGSQDYLGVRWSLVWLRKEHPDAQIVTEHVQIDGTIAIFKATVTLPTGGVATGYGSETASDFGDYIEKAETKAIGRALRALGFGATNSEGGDESEPVPAPSPQRRSGSTGAARQQPTPIDRSASERPAASSRPAPAERQATDERPAPAAEPLASRPTPDSAPSGRSRPTAAMTQTAPDAAPRRTAPPVDAATPPRITPEPAPAPSSAPPPGVSRSARVTEDADLADYSWSAFWPWARSIGLLDKKSIEDLIGRSTDGLLPAELRGLILAAQGKN